MVGVIVPIGIGGILLFALWFWAILDCIATDAGLVRNLPKMIWQFVVIMIPTAGALAWLLLGRPEGSGLRIGGKYRVPNYKKRSRSRGFEDSAEWATRSRQIKPPRPADKSIGESSVMEERDLAEWEAQLKKREAGLDDDLPPQPSD